MKAGAGRYNYFEDEKLAQVKIEVNIFT